MQIIASDGVVEVYKRKINIDLKYVAVFLTLGFQNSLIFIGAFKLKLSCHAVAERKISVPLLWRKTAIMFGRFLT